jgi:hypothetical protein
MDYKPLEENEPFEPDVKPEMSNYQFVFGRIQAPGGNLMVLSIYTVIGGPIVLMMTADMAKGLGSAIVQEADLLLRGLILPEGFAE